MVIYPDIFDIFPVLLGLSPKFHGSSPWGNVLKNLSGLLRVLRQREAKVLLLQQLSEQVARNEPTSAGCWTINHWFGVIDVGKP